MNNEQRNIYDLSLMVDKQRRELQSLRDTQDFRLRRLDHTVEGIKIDIDNIFLAISTLSDRIDIVADYLVRQQKGEGASS